MTERERRELLAELARVKAMFQLLVIATHLGKDWIQPDLPPQPNE